MKGSGARIRVESHEFAVDGRKALGFFEKLSEGSPAENLRGERIQVPDVFQKLIEEREILLFFENGIPTAG